MKSKKIKPTEQAVLFIFMIYSIGGIFMAHKAKSYGQIDTIM